MNIERKQGKLYLLHKFKHHRFRAPEKNCRNKYCDNSIEQQKPLASMYFELGSFGGASTSLSYYNPEKAFGDFIRKEQVCQQTKQMWDLNRTFILFLVVSYRLNLAHGFCGTLYCTGIPTHVFSFSADSNLLSHSAFLMTPGDGVPNAASPYRLCLKCRYTRKKE